MSDRPIVLTADEVRETLAGRMSHILRPMHPQPEWDSEMDGGRWWIPGRHVTTIAWDSTAPSDFLVRSGYSPGAVGDRLWVRETWGVGSRPDPFTGCRDGVEYRADEGLLQEGEALPLWSVEPPTGVDLDAIRPGWHSSTSMPRWAARLLLDVVAVRVIRLGEITEEVATSAGFEAGWYPRSKRDNGPVYASAKTRAEIAWNKRHGGPNGDGPLSTWACDPWIWDITVKRVEG